MFTEETIRREMRKCQSYKENAMARYAARPTEGLAKTIEMLYGAECALSWALNRKGEETLKVSAQYE